MKESRNISIEEITQWLDTEDSSEDSALQQTEDAIIRFAEAYALHPSAGLKERIMDKINSMNIVQTHRSSLDLDNLPVLDESSNWMDWQEAVKDIHPPENYNGIHLFPLKATPKCELFVAWVKEYIDEEVHTDLIESFILLEGSCECHITDLNGKKRIERMVAGDYIQMDTGEAHDVIITSLEPVKAILQWMKLSA
ncbi:MAG: hypothetical protein ABIR66_09630 [Saprospiraceae bacterium]